MKAPSSTLHTKFEAIKLPPLVTPWTMAQLFYGSDSSTQLQTILVRISLHSTESIH